MALDNVCAGLRASCLFRHSADEWGPRFQKMLTKIVAAI
jgi:hypothetical protein